MSMQPAFESVAQWWDAFARATLPRNCSTVQRWEVRRAFYAGAFAMLTACANIGEDAVSEEQGIQWLEAWRKEITEFYESVKAGTA